MNIWEFMSGSPWLTGISILLICEACDSIGVAFCGALSEWLKGKK